MYKVSFSKESESENLKNKLIYNKKIDEIFSNRKETDKAFLNFSKIFIKNIPFHLLEILSDKDLYSFLLHLFQVIKNRRKKKYFYSVIKPDESDFFIGNFTIIALNTDDRPFLIDSIREYFYEIDLNEQLIIHPIFNIKRDFKGDITEIDEPKIGTKNESFVVIFIESIDSNLLNRITDELSKIYEEVILSVDDFQEMSNILSNLSLYYKNRHVEVSEFLEWINNKNFIIQGIRTIHNIDLTTEDYTIDQYGVYKLNKSADTLSSLISSLKENRFRYVDGFPVVIDKALYTSKVKKRRNYDRIMVIDNKDGKYSIISIIGIFSKEGRKTSPFDIPIIKKKLSDIIEFFGFVNGSHDHKWLIDILESFPKTEIFSLDKDTIISVLKTIFSIQGKNQIVFYTKELKPLKNFYLFMVFPQEKFSTEILEDVKSIFQQELKAVELDTSVRSDEHGFVFVHFHFYLTDIDILDKVDFGKIKFLINDLLKDFEDELYEALKLRYSSHKSDELFHKFKKSFSNTYKTKCSPNEAVEDIKYLLNLKDFSSTLYVDDTKCTIKIYSKRRILLTDIMPIIDNMGLKVNEEFIFAVTTDEATYFINSIYLAEIENREKFKSKYSKIIPELIVAVLSEKIENDVLNKLLIAECLAYKEIDFLRGVRNYIEQINHYFRRVSLNETLINNSKIAKLFIDYLYEKFDPEKKERDFRKIEDSILSLIDQVVLVQEDSILRHFYKVITSIVRTNYFIKGRDYISFKISSKNLDILPEPKPLYEIYVHSFYTEGIHLRGGKVARGGLRFSDRPDDFRTEVLGLLKTQMVKNAVIVPVGSKGGFVVKKRFADKNKDKEHVINQYKIFIRGLLDITDNYKGEKVVHPSNVVVYDEKDPYLVVAADKGTATFSDIANSISKDYGFWLGDAFASGGSTGYDHKKVGITAKGAWECIKRHFRELGKDIQTEPFTVIGIGDMSGDVFGNGMLLSKQIKLIAAFNHIHIFVDPNPDPEISYIERLRLFKLPGSTWRDYNQDIISKGGGVFERSAKKIKLTPEIIKLLNIQKDVVSGEELIRYILKAEAELLFNGGIGTYVKDDLETDEEAGDKANDNVRINASELKVKVVGEGGNLGLTQKARIRFALNGGLVNTDALDNSAGVDMSDHEVNIKILLNILLKNKELKDEKERNRLIVKLTPEVTKLVLRDNYLQSNVVSLDFLKSKKDLIYYKDTAEYLKEVGLLNFEIEEINFIKEKRPITRPELCVLLAYTKIHLYHMTLNSFDLNNKVLKEEYLSYYPETLIKSYSKYFDYHKLKREITATVAVNKAVNQAGISSFIELYKRTGKPFANLIETYLFADRLLNTDKIRGKIEALDLKVDAKLQYLLFNELERTLKIAVSWLINENNVSILNGNKKIFEEVCKKTVSNVTGEIKKDYNNLLQYLRENGCSQGLAKEVCDIKFLKPAFDLFEIVARNRFDINKTIKAYYKIGEIFNLPLFIFGIKSVNVATSWDVINRDNLVTRVKVFQKQFTEKYVQNSDSWLKGLEKKDAIFFVNYNNFLQSITAKEFDTLIPYNVMMDTLFNMLSSN